MKTYFGIFILALMFSCNHSKEQKHEGHDDSSNDSPNQALYDEVMSIHDEVMPKMEDLYKLKKDLQSQLENGKDLAEDKKAELEKMIASLDSTSNSMMDWMHNFNPIPDSVDQEKAREYLENQMEQIKKVKEVTIEVIEKAKEKQ